MLVDDLLDLLTSEGVGTKGDTMFGGPYPSEPSAVLGILETGGFPYEYTMTTDPVIERRRVQVMVRSTGYYSASAWAQQVTNRLDGLRPRLLNGVHYHWAQAVSPPAYVGTDDNGLFLFSLNFDVARDRSTTA